MFEQYQYDMNLVRKHFWQLYLTSNSPSKFLLDKEGGISHHYILKLWTKFLIDDHQVKLMFWNNDELGIAPTHFFSKIYEKELSNATVFERRCVGYLCSFLMQSRSLVSGKNKAPKGIRVASDAFRIKHGQVYV